MPLIGDGIDECLSRRVVWEAAEDVGVEVFIGNISFVTTARVEIVLLAPCSDRECVEEEDHIL